MKVVPRILDRLVLRKLRGTLGHRLRFMITGSAPTPVWLLEYFDRLGVLLLEAYGLSENTVPIAANRPDAYRFGSVGKVFAANEVRIAEDDEILVRGPGLFDGYAGDDALPTGKFTEDGFYRTGDLGRIDTDGFLYISGRKSDVFKTSTGRWVAPAHVEAAYRSIPYIEQIVVFGQGRRFAAALLTVNERLLASTLQNRGLALSADAGGTNLVSLEVVRRRIEADIEAAGSALNTYERIRRFEFLPAPLTFEGGELTPSLKLRRDVIAQKYAALIDRLYAEAA
jgi:long-chain acyl-CoA synthetase